MFIGHTVWDLAEIRLGIGYQQILGLRAMNRIAKTPASDGLVSLSMPALSLVP